MTETNQQATKKLETTEDSYEKIGGDRVLKRSGQTQPDTHNGV